MINHIVFTFSDMKNGDTALQIVDIFNYAGVKVIRSIDDVESPDLLREYSRHLVGRLGVIEEGNGECYQTTSYTIYPLYGVIYARGVPPKEFSTLKEAVRFSRSNKYSAIYLLPFEGLLWSELSLCIRLGAYKDGIRL